MQIQNAIITGSFSYNGADLSNVTSSNAYSASLSSRTTDLESTSSVLVGASSSFSSILTSVSSSQQQLSSSFLTLTASFNAVSASQQQISASYIALSASYNTFSGSASTRITVDSASLLQVSASQQQISASYIALSGSYNVFSGSASTRVTQIEQVYATTGSNSFRATQSITGSLTVTGQIIAQTINVQQVTSSIIYSSGSNNFGCDLNSRQTFTGSVLITGSLTIAGASSAASYSGTTIYGSTAVCSAVGLFSGCVGIGTVSPGTRLEVVATSENVLKLKNSGGQPSLVRFNDTSTTLDPYIGSYGNDLAFGIYGGGERMRILSGGNVGIGCTTPDYKLDISGSLRTTAGTYLGTSSSNVIIGGTTSDLIANFKFITIGNTAFQYGASTGTYLRIEPGAADTEVALKADARSGGYPPMTFYTTATERMRITSTGIACFACQVCAPSYISSNASTVSYQDGQYIVGNSESEVCTLGPATSAYVPMKYWIADRTGTIRTKFAAYIVSGPNYWAYQFRKNGSSVLANGHYNSTLEPGYCSNVHSYTTFTNVLCSLSPGDCITYEMASANSGGTPTNGSGTQCFYVKELRFLSNSPSISNNYTNNVFGEWVGLGTSCPLSNLEIRNSNEAAYDASVDNGQDGCGVTMTIRNGNTTTNSFAQLNLQVSGDSGRAIGRIALIRRDSATADMAFITENANTKSEKMRITSGGSTCFYGTVLSVAPNNGHNFRGLGFSTGAIATGGSCLIYSSLDRGLYLISIASSVTSTYGYSAFLWVDSGNITVSSVIRQACVGITTSGRALCVVNQYGSETAIMTVTTLNLLNYIG